MSAAGQRPVVLDTSALLYWTLRPETVKQGRLSIGMSVEEFADRLATVSGLEITPVGVPIWLRNLALPWAHRDPADRTIVATADLLGARLVTSDRAIGAYYSRTVW